MPPSTGTVRQIANATALDAGAGFSAAAVAATPFALGETGFWTRSTDGHPMFTDASGVDHDLQP